MMLKLFFLMGFDPEGHLVQFIIAFQILKEFKRSRLQ